MLDGPQSRSGHGGEEKKIPSPCRISCAEIDHPKYMEMKANVTHNIADAHRKYV
jgi:O-methyltransferase involved in polyketide biosynthesis